MVIIAFLWFSNLSFGQSIQQSCPKTSAGWVAWKRQLLAQPTTVGDVQNVAVRCLWDLESPSAAFGACLEPLRRLSTLQRARQTDLSASDDPNHPFALPRSFFEPDAFQKITSGDSTLAERQAAFSKLLAKQPNAVVVEFASEVISTPEHPHNSIIGRLKRPQGDLWFHTERPQKGPLISPASLLVLGVRKKDGAGKRLKTPEIDHFDTFLFSDGGPIQRFQSRSGDSTCMGCHRTGAFPLVPRVGVPSQTQILFSTKKTTGADLIQELNNSIGDEPNVKHPHLDMADFGPPLGPVIKRSPEELKRLLGGHVPKGVSLANLGVAMNCALCHIDPNQGRAGPISFPLIGDTIGESTFAHMIRSGHMPPDPKLNVAEREALLQLLHAEYLGGFTDPKLGGGKNTLPGQLLLYLRNEAACREFEAQAAAEEAATKVDSQPADGGVAQ